MKYRVSSLMSSADWNLLSRQRTPLMGLAIIMIMLFHSGWLLENPVMSIMFCCGDIGVDIFAVLSGIGCYYSLNKDSSITNFYKRRFFRVFPVFFMVSIAYGLYRHFRYGASWTHVLLLSTGLETFRGDISFWFITYIMICYLAAPLLLYLKNRMNKRFLLTIGISVVSVLFFLILNNRLVFCSLWVLRFPAFVLGIDIADLVRGNDINPVTRKLSTEICKLLVLLIVLSLCRRSFPDWAKLIYLVLVLPTIFVTGHLLERFANSSRAFAYVGTLTLEIYLIHSIAVFPFLKYFVHINEWILLPIAIIVTIFSAKLLSVAMSKFKKLCGMHI